MFYFSMIDRATGSRHDYRFTRFNAANTALTIARAAIDKRRFIITMIGWKP